jgi:hypothetical protein
LAPYLLRVTALRSAWAKHRRYMQAHKTDFNFAGLIGKIQRNSGDAFHDSVVKSKLNIFLVIAKLHEGFERFFKISFTQSDSPVTVTDISS